MSGWGDPVVGGVDLRRAAIRSPNYVAGSTGWTINQDGSVEFNNGTFRGVVTASTFQGSNFVINQSGEFFYSGTPASGNLIVSVTNNPGTDAFGNQYLQGLTTFDRLNNNYTNVQGAVVSFGPIAAGQPDTTHNGFVLGGGGVLTLSATTSASLTDAGVLNVFAGQPNQVSGHSGPAVQLLDTAGTSEVDFTLAGNLIKSDKTGAVLTWQTPSYAANWSNSTSWGSFGGGGNLLFRKTGLDRTWIQGVAKAATGAGTTIFTLPAGYFHPTQTTWGSAVRASGGVTSVVAIAVSNAGAVISSVTPVNGDQFLLNFEIPLGNIA
jgi:hypothetical protein